MTPTWQNTNPDYTTCLSNNTGDGHGVHTAYDYEAWAELALRGPEIKAMIKHLNDLAVEIQELREKCEQLQKEKDYDNRRNKHLRRKI